MTNLNVHMQIMRNAYQRKAEFLADFGNDAEWVEEKLLYDITPCHLVVFDDIISRIQKGKPVIEAYGVDFNANLLEALSYPAKTNKCADIGPGHLSPYPSFLLALGCDKVSTYDIRFPEQHDPEIEPRTAMGTKPIYDLITCISVFEHCGLGRYDDSLNPSCDFELMRDIKRMLKKDGTLIFAVPLTSKKGGVHYNHHRIYDQHRLDKLTEGLEIIAEIGERMTGDERKQPVIVTRKG